MNNKIKTLALGSMIAMAASLSAQNTNSGYFLEGYTYRYQMNPAFANDMNFVSIPALGDLNIAMRGNTHVSDLIHVVDGKTVLFTNPGVSNSFLKDLPGTSRIGADIKINILSGGWKAWGGYNTVSLNARADVGVSVPKTFFQLAKEGIANKTYDIHNLNARALGYAEIALNHSRDIAQVPGLRAGAGVKFLIGIAALEAKFNQADLTLGENEWIARTNADVYANVGGFQYKMKDYNNKYDDTKRPYVSGANLDGDGSVGPNGFGMAFDLGATYKWRDFNFSLAVLDLGWISYFDTKHASTNGTRIVNTDAYTFNADDKEFNPDGSKTNSFENEWDRLSDNLATLYQLDDNGNSGTRNVGLGATLNIGVEYELPYYRPLHFGFLSSTRINGNYTWSEARFSANVNPVKCFSAGINMGLGTYGASFGWLLNFTTKGFNIFLGMDTTPGKLAKQGVPLNSNVGFNFGMNVPF